MIWCVPYTVVLYGIPSIMYLMIIFFQPPEKIESKVNPDKPLPFQRKTEILEYGYVELDSVPPGRLSLKQALQLLSKYQLDKTTNTVEKLALDYNLSPKDVGEYSPFVITCKLHVHMKLCAI